ncbi:hypothetical protein ADICYQ_2012 [Cyclobacterium qasimii M12-11B]|uniref:Uncharacterized protein n=1 Tax=Cyclobacterium qasimii M12-11B TaxID=641524 RepID=S7VFA9_9BACT|nr:hypothetical protein ADICYQ_2012 [Cyclobacterium qasimii M12-11B]
MAFKSSLQTLIGKQLRGKGMAVAPFRGVHPISPPKSLSKPKWNDFLKN